MHLPVPPQTAEKTKTYGVGSVILGNGLIHNAHDIKSNISENIKVLLRKQTFE